MIDHLSNAGAWRAALNPDASCARCRQVVCDHPDAVYAGLLGKRLDDVGGESANRPHFAPVPCLHNIGDSL